MGSLVTRRTDTSRLIAALQPAAGSSRLRTPASGRTGHALRMPLLALAIVSAAAPLACGDDDDSSRGSEPQLSSERAREVAIAYARGNGLITDEPVSTSSLVLPVEQARQFLTSAGQDDPFAGLSPAMPEDALVWVVSLVVRLIQPSPDAPQASISAEGVSVVVDDASGEAVWVGELNGSVD